MKTPFRLTLLTALGSLRRNPLRTCLLWLTTAIGIAAVVSVVSVVKGGTTAFRHDMSRLGIGIITFSSNGLDGETREKVKQKFADSGAQFSFAQIDLKKVTALHNGVSNSCMVVEVDRNFFDVFGLRILEGRNLDYSPVRGNSDIPECLIDQERRRELFGDASAVGRYIKVEYPLKTITFRIFGKPIEIKYPLKTITLKIAGVVEDPMTMRKQIDRFDTGNLSRMLSAQHLTFKNIYVARGSYEKPLPASNMTLMLVKPPDMYDIDGLNSRISAFLGENNIEFQSFTMNRWLEALNVATTRLEDNSNMIWVIILSVSAILIMLMNYLGVREKFREIAIRRVEGASRPAIIAQVGIESLLISLLAGIGGIIIGVVVTEALCAWVVEWPPNFTVPEIAMALGLSIFVGTISAVLPALRAAQVNPAAILRYE